MNTPAILLILIPIHTAANPAEPAPADSRAIVRMDCNGDGIPERVVGDCRGVANGVRCGTVCVRDGRSGKVLFRLAGDSTGDRFGWSIAAAGDVDADGVGDFLVGSPLDDPNGNGSGSASVFSGRDGSLLRKFCGTAPGQQFGYSVAAAGDVDGDGHADLLVGAPFANGKARRAGYVRVFSGKDGAVIRTTHGKKAGARLGKFAGR